MAVGEGGGGGDKSPLATVPICSARPVRLLRWSDPQSDYINTIWLEDCQALRHNVAKNIICNFHLKDANINTCFYLAIQAFEVEIRLKFENLPIHWS